MNRLQFEKVADFARKREPVSLSVPFQQGRLTDPSRLGLEQGGQRIPVQTRVLSSWRDGSVRWLRLHSQPDLRANAYQELDFCEEGGSPAPEQSLVVEKLEHGIQVNTGPLQFMLPDSGFFPVTEVTLHGKRMWMGYPFGGFHMHVGEYEVNSAPSEVTQEVIEGGPLRAEILIQGKHRGSYGDPYLDFRGRVVAYAGKPYVAVEHWFLHKEGEAEGELRSLLLEFLPSTEQNAELSVGEGYYGTHLQRDTEALERYLGAETLLYQANEHYEPAFYGDFWADWRTEDSGLAVSIYQAHQNFPKKLRAMQGGIECWLFPVEAPAVAVRQGMGKSHRILLHFHDGRLPLEEVSRRSLQFQLPDIPTLSPGWYRENNPWAVDVFPAQLPDRWLTRLLMLHESRPLGLGMMHYGDAPDAGYTDQGRGKGSTVWVNNEYDRAHAAALLYCLTGQRSALASCEACARHGLEVDLCWKSEDPLREGGLVCHSRDHVTGGVTPSHEWVEGFLDYYHLTGNVEGLLGAEQVAGNLLRHLEEKSMKTPGALSARDGGWTLRALAAMWWQTREDRFEAASVRLTDLFLEWEKEYGTLLAPYTSHSMPRVPFMVSIACNSMARWHAMHGDDAVKDFVVRAADDLLRSCTGKDGVLYYKEFPSLKRPAPTIHAIELLAQAYAYSKERRFLTAAVRNLCCLQERSQWTSSGMKKRIEGNALIKGEGNGRSFANLCEPLLRFFELAGEKVQSIFEYPV